MKKTYVSLVSLMIICLLAGMGWGAEQKARQPFDLIIYGLTAGGASYVAATGLADVINKNHPWIKASPMETFGSNDSIKKLENNTKAISPASDLSYWSALDGEKPFDKKYTNIRACGLNLVGAWAMLVTNPNIKSKEDLVGKRIAMGLRGSVISTCSEFLLGTIWGMMDKVKPLYIGWKEGVEAMKDGQADGMTAVVSLSSDENDRPKWINHPSFAELIALKKVYFIGATKEEWKRGTQEKNWPLAYLEMPPKALGENQPNGAWLFSIINPYFCDKGVPDEVVYEVGRMQYDHYKAIGTYAAHSKFITPNTLGFSAISSEAEFHPAYLKFLKEKNIKIYINGDSPPLR